MPQSEKEEIATLTCNIIGETRNMDGAMRIKELNAARERIGGERFLGTDEDIRASLRVGLCKELILLDDASYIDFYLLNNKQNKDFIKILDSQPIFSSELNGKWVLINYWADWCPPCIKEIPEIVSFSKKYPEVKVFAYNFDRLEAEDLRWQIKKFGIEYPSIITHPKTVWGIQTPSTLPATYFISPDGEVVFTSLKPQDEESLSLVYEDLQNGV